jgi:hypothetical protein
MRRLGSVMYGCSIRFVPIAKGRVMSRRGAEDGQSTRPCASSSRGHCAEIWTVRFGAILSSNAALADDQTARGTIIDCMIIACTIVERTVRRRADTTNIDGRSIDTTNIDSTNIDPAARSSIQRTAVELALAAEHDAAGRHDAAVDALANAAGRGDVEALTRLGLRLVVGDRAPLLPREGVGFLVDATTRGGAEAPMRLATLAALGAHMRQNWNDALGLLVLAAERGAEPARAQLTLLSTDLDLARIAGAARTASTAGVAAAVHTTGITAVEDAPYTAGMARTEQDGTPPDLWRRLGRGIDLRAWTAAPEGRTLHSAPAIRMFPGFAPSAVCTWLIERSRSKLKRALVYDAAGRRNIADESRTNTVAEFDLGDTDIVQALLQLRMSAASGIPVSNMEAPAVLHYDVGQQIVNHYDFVDPDTPSYEREIAERGERVMTFLVYLNDDYTGGETDFPRLGVSHKGRIGDGLCFVNALPEGGPDRRMLHAGRPPTRGEKWIVSQFIRNRAALPAGAAPLAVAR